MQLKGFIKKIKKVNIDYLVKCNYIKYYKKYKIDEKTILLESQHGKEINGNIYYIICELNGNKEYENYKIYLSVIKKNKKTIEEFLKQKNINRIELVETNSAKYFKTISKAKYLINDNTFLPFFIKKEGQIYLNTWHGTPLKSLGKKIKNDLHNIGNTQKNFIVSDYLLYPNEYTKEHMIEDYMIENLTSNTIILHGYPRNTVFFNEEQRSSIKSELNLNNKQIIAYMPTWRGTLNKKNTKQQQTALNSILEEMEEKLTENQVLYVNLHPIERATVDYTKYTKIKPFPAQYETYEFLNIADLLITDYSSVFFDYANTRKKIILFTYDKEQYLADRGLYKQLEELPFPIVCNTESLIKELNIPKQYDDEQFLKEFCQYDNKDATKKICERVILNKKNNVKEEKMHQNQKENIFMYPGNLSKNGITSSLKNLLSSIDGEKKNYYLLVDAKAVENYKEQLAELAEHVNYITIKGKMNLSIFDKIIYFLFKAKKINAENFMKRMKENYEIEIKRILGEAKVDAIIQFSGYSDRKTLLFSAMKCKKVIYVHNNMQDEIRTRGNQREDVLRYAYNIYDHIVVVTEDLISSTSEFMKAENRDKIIVSKNFIDYKSIKEKSMQDLQIEDNTIMNVSMDRLKEILNSSNKKFVNVGRFSPEKGQDRLIDCFNKLWQEDSSIYLILIGGHGVLYNKILKHIDSLQCKEHIITIKSVNNPFAIVEKCDYFVLSSFYEGFGLVIAEADILNLPVISTDIVGPRKFMQQNGGTLVEDSEEGIYKGMKMLLNNEIKPMNVDYEKYNQEALEQFEKILKI